MRIDSDMQEFVKRNRGMLKKIVESRTQDYLNMVVDEPDPQRKEVFSLFVKELRLVLTAIDNIGNQKEKPKPGETFTGV